MPMLPVIIRVDGKAFHTFTKGLARPYDKGLSETMIRTTEALVKETNALIGYTQSDEISLLLYSDSFESALYLDGRPTKINSILATVCTDHFREEMKTLIPSKLDKKPRFDCRCFNVPNQAEAINAFLWREQDAVRNSIQMAGQANFSHKQLQNKSCNEIQEMLFQEKGINWNDYWPHFKRGTYVQRRRVTKPFTPEEKALLNPRHKANLTDNLMVERVEMRHVDMPPLNKVVNKTEVFFSGADPLTEE